MELFYYAIAYYGVIPQALPPALSKTAADQLEFPQQQQFKKRRPCFLCTHANLRAKYCHVRMSFDSLYYLKFALWSPRSNPDSFLQFLHITEETFCIYINHTFCVHHGFLFKAFLFRPATSICLASLICSPSVPVAMVWDAFNPKHIF